MNKQIKVCHVLHGIVGGGSEQVVLNYCSRMSAIHFDLLYQYDPNPQILERFNEAGINCIRIPDKVHHPVSHLLAMYRQFKKGHYDVVHSHLDWYMNVTAMFCAWLAGVKKRFSHHHQAYQLEIFFLKLLSALLRIPNKIFATHWLACGVAAARNGWGEQSVANGKVTILPNAIDPERFKFDENARKVVRAQYGIAEDELVVGHVGRFFPEKNHQFIIELFALLKKKKENAKLLLVGDGPLQEKIKNLVQEKCLEDFVIFAGLQKDTVPYYCAMDVLLLPSVREAFPMTLVEAQYNGLQCIVSDAVPKEVSITSNVKALPINETQLWVAELAKHQTRNTHASVNIMNDSFDIRNSYKLLESLYQSP